MEFWVLFRRYISARALLDRLLAVGGVVGWLVMVAVGDSLLSSHTQRKKKLDILTANIKLVPRKSMLLISRI